MTNYNEHEDTITPQSETKGKPNQLLRVGLINSYLHSQTHIIDVDRNNLLTGANAAGKTSLMNAIAPFYGVPLSVLSRKTEANKSFIDHFLPNDNSYIVYEYLRDNEHRCVILRRIKDRPWFNFFTGKLDGKLFVGDRRSGGQYFKTYEEAKQSIEDDGRTITPNFTQGEYEAIISNAAPNRLKFEGSHQSAKTVSRYRHDFSLATGRKSTFYGFSPILSNIMESKLSFNDLTNFLIDAMRTQEIIDMDSIQFDTSNIDTSYWVNQRKTWLEIDKLKPVFSDLNDCLRANFTNQTQLADNNLLIKDVLAKVEIELATANAARDKHLTTKEGLAQKLSDLEINWHKTNSNLNTDIAQKIKEINYIELKKTKFELGSDSGLNQPIHKLREQAGKLLSLEDEKADLQKKRDFHREQLTDKAFNVEMINQQYDSEIKRLQSVKSDKLGRITTNESDANLEHSKRTAAIESEYSADARQLTEQHQKEKDRLQAAISKIEVELAKLDGRIEGVKYSAGHQSAIDDNTLQLEQQRDNKDAAQAQLDESKVVIDGIASKMQAVHDNQAARRTALKEIESQILSQRALIQGNTLFSFLLSSEPELGYNHVSKIRKVINQDLLTAANLKPEWADGSNELRDNIFGLKVDTNAILPPKDKSKTHQEILELIDSLDKRASEIKAEIEHDATELEKLARDRSAATSASHQVAARLNKINSDLKIIKDNGLHLIAKAKEDTQQRINQITLDKERYNQDLTSLVEQQAITDQAKKSQLLSISQERNAKILTAQSLKEERLLALSNEREAVIADHKEKAAQATLFKDQAIENEGYDPRVLDLIDEEIKVLAQQIFAAEKAKVRVADYDQFMIDEYPQVAILDNEKRSIQETLDSAKTAYETEAQALGASIHEATSEEKRLKAFSEQLKADVNHLTTQVRAIAVHLNHAFVVENGYQPKASDVKQDEAHLLAESAIRSTQQSIRAASAATEKGRMLVAKIKKPFDLNSASFDRLVSDPDYIGLASESNWHKRANLFIDYINNEHETRLEAIVQGYKSISEQLNNFKYKLDSVNSHLKIFARAINKNFIDICNNLDSIAIETCELTLKSTIESNEWYSTLSDFSDAYSRWQGSERLSNPLPSENLIAKIDMVQKHIGQNQLNINLADQFLISLTVKQYGQDARTATRDSSVKDLSSNGTIRIAQLMVYLALAQTLVRAEGTQLKLFIDEIGVIDKDNTKELMELLASQGLSAMCAAPEVVDDAIIPLFANNTRCTRDRKNIYRLSQTSYMRNITHEHKMAHNGAFDLPDFQ